MGGALTDDNRGLSASSRLTQGLDAKIVDALMQGMRGNDASAQKYAQDDVARRRPLVAQMMAQHWTSERDRCVYLKYYIIAAYVASGLGQPDSDELYGAMYMYESDYQKKIAERADAQKRAQAVRHVTAKGQSAPMNPLADFDDTIIQVPLEKARLDYRWVESDIIEGAADISDDTKRQALVLLYKDGNVLSIPLAPVPVLYRVGLKDTSTAPYFRRHKASGRLVPFHPSLDELEAFPADAPFDLVLRSVPPRFDAVLTPAVLTWRDMVNSRSLGAQFGVLTMGFGAIATASGGASAAGKFATSTTLGANLGSTVGPAVATARAGLKEVVFAVREYGLSRAAVSYLGRTAWGFYLRNAVVVNLLAVSGTEMTLNFAGVDTGPVSPGDDLYFAVSTATKEAQLIKAEVEELDKATHMVKVRVVSAETMTAEDAEKALFIAHEPKGQGITTPRPPTLPAGDAKAVNTKSTDAVARATQDATAAATAKKVEAAKAAAAAKAYNINHIALLSDAEAAKLEKMGVHPEAIEKLRSIAIGELDAARLKPDDVAKLYKKLAASGKDGVVVDFINTFHEAPNFQMVVLSWASGGKGQKGANFAMRFALEYFPDQAIRFEWPVAVAVSRAGEEGSMAARYVDIVVDGGNRFRAGESLRIELKTWTDGYLNSAKSTESITRQLARDTAYFGKENIRWVFDSRNGLTKEMVLDRFVDVIKNDGLLSKQWAGTDAEIRAALAPIISMYP